jgi:hypothetical protein
VRAAGLLVSPGDLLMSARPDRKELEYLFGCLLGFPPCCVRSFVYDCRVGVRLPQASLDVLRAQQPSGFIPCPDHEAQIVAGLRVSDLLRRKRNVGRQRFEEIRDLVECLDA